MSRRIKLYLSAAGIIILPFLATHFFVPNKQFESNAEQFEFAQTYQEGVPACEAYAELLKADSLNSSYQFAFAKEWYNADKKERQFMQFRLRKQDAFPPDRDARWRNSSDAQRRNHGLFGRAALYIYFIRALDTKFFLDSISDDNFPGKNLLLGMAALDIEAFDTAEKYFQQEVVNDEFKQIALEELYQIYLRHGSYDKISDLLNEPLLNGIISPTLERYIYFWRGDYLKYFITIPKHMYSGASWMVLIGAVLVVLMWLYYMAQLNKLVNITVSLVVTCFFLACVADVPCLMLYDLYTALGFGFEGSFINDLTYSIFCIGLIEELTKLLPILLLLKIKPNWFNKPMDYIFAAMACALAFSFTENIMYFSKHGLEIISTRAIVCVLGHMICSCIAVYGFVVAKFNNKKGGLVLTLIKYFLLACVLHGVYDFGLIYSESGALWFISVFAELAGLYYWGSILNNSLNNSGAYANQKLLNLERLNVSLVALFCGFFFIEYFVYSIVFGPSQSIFVVEKAAFSGLYIIPFLAFRLSRIDLSPSGWDSLVGSDNITFDLTEILDHPFSLHALKNVGTIATMLPCNGIITERITIKNDRNWFLFVPDAGSKHPNRLLLKLKDDQYTYDTKDVVVYVRQVKQVTVFNEGPLPLNIFPFVDWGVLNKLD